MIASLGAACGGLVVGGLVVGGMFLAARPATPTLAAMDASTGPAVNAFDLCRPKPASMPGHQPEFPALAQREPSVLWDPAELLCVSGPCSRSLNDDSVVCRRH